MLPAHRGTLGVIGACLLKSKQQFSSIEGGIGSRGDKQISPTP